MLRIIYFSLGYIEKLPIVINARLFRQVIIKSDAHWAFDVEIYKYISLLQVGFLINKERNGWNPHKNVRLGTFISIKFQNGKW